MKVYVVHGPPLSGKSTYVKERCGPNDLVYDFDLIMSAITGQPVHKHNDHLVGYVLSIRDLIIARLKGESRLDNAWIITNRVTRKLRDQLEPLKPEYVELKTDINTAKKRLYDNPDGRDIKTWESVIDKHFGGSRNTKQVIFYKTMAWRRKRLEILERDNYECQLCKREGKYNKGNTVHHIKHLEDRPDLALVDDNLLSVCAACHNREHPERFIQNFAEPRKNNLSERFPEHW